MCSPGAVTVMALRHPNAVFRLRWGDAWEYWGGSNRYIFIAVPGLVLVLACGLSRLSQLISDGSKKDPMLASLLAIQSRRAAFPMLIGVNVLCVNSIHGVGALVVMLLINAPVRSGGGGENGQHTMGQTPVPNLPVTARRRLRSARSRWVSVKGHGR
jgi:hypothetical protein